MVTIDEKGKALVFGSPDSPVPAIAEGQESADQDGWTDVAGGMKCVLMNTTPRVIRVTERQAFARILYGKLWTSAGSGIPSGEGPAGPSGSGSGISGTPSNATSGRGPIIRVYDVFSPLIPSRENSDVSSSSGSLPPPTASSLGKAATLLSTEGGVGAVTSATVLVTKPGLVYVGHEGGYVTIWDTSSSNATSEADPNSSTASLLPPKCVQTLKVATTDIVCLEGVHDKLWTGSRNGFISAYDVAHRPWMATNVWKHGGFVGSEVEGNRKGLPVLRLLVDYTDLEKVRLFECQTH